mgnify:CR=1 FL=1
MTLCPQCGQSHAAAGLPPGPKAACSRCSASLRPEIRTQAPQTRETPPPLSSAIAPGSGTKLAARCAEWILARPAAALLLAGAAGLAGLLLGAVALLLASQRPANPATPASASMTARYENAAAQSAIAGRRGEAAKKAEELKPLGF